MHVQPHLSPLTLERAGHVCLSDDVVLDGEGQASLGRTGHLGPGEHAQVVGDDGHRTAGAEVGATEDVRQVLVLLRVEVLGRNEMRRRLYTLMDPFPL